MGSRRGRSARRDENVLGPQVTKPEKKATEFEEVAHSGGTVIFHVQQSEDGRLGVSTEFRGASGGPMSTYALYALLADGVPVADLKIGGINQPFDPPPPVRGCILVFMVSDSTGVFGRRCPSCGEYWRSDYGNYICPYCGTKASANFHLLTEAQLRYVAEYCETLREGYASGKPGDYVIDMDAVADAAGKATPKPPFYYAEEKQQNEFACEACGDVNDVLGRYAYCSSCGTRNDIQEMRAIVQGIRDRINAGGPFESCVRDTVAAFDSLAGITARQLVSRVPLVPERKGRMSGRFHNLARAAADFREIFGIDILDGFSSDDAAFATRMFHRRHVYEHKGGEADEQYIRDSGDDVRVKQILREDKESAHRIATLVTKMASNLHQGFHELFPPEEEPIKYFKKCGRRP